MSLRVRASVLVALVTIVACGDDPAAPIATVLPGKGAESPAAAVSELIDAINVPDFADASRLAMPGQAALASLAEGASFGAVATALREGDEKVAANFWAGFAQGTENFLIGDIGVTEDGEVTDDDARLHVVSVSPENGDSRTIFVGEDDGYRIDIFASFGAGLADKMIGPIERLLVTQTEDSRLILDELRDVVPSLLSAAGQPGTSGEVSQQLLALVEVITRIG